MSTPMKFFVCPKCEQRSITVRDKYLSGHWINIYCPACGARLFAEPVLLALVYMGYFWAVSWFVTWAMLEDDWSLVLYLIPVWLIIDFLSLAYMPLRVMRPKVAAPRE
jgi:hypothetical protein